MKFTSFNFKFAPVVLCTLILELAQTGLLFSQEPVSKKIYSDKEEIELRAKPSLSKEDISGQAPRFFLNIKEGKFKKQKAPKTEKIFKPEIGIVEVITHPSESYAVLNLKNCIDIAVKNHLPLQIAQKNIALAKMRLWETRRNMLPSVSMVYSEYSGRIYERAYIGRKQYIEGQQPIFHGGELYYTMKQAETNLEIVKNEYDKVKNELVLQVKKAYYTLAKAKENMRLQQALAQEVERIFNMVTKGFDDGAVSKLELLNVTSQAGQAKYQLTSAEGDESVAGLILKQAMNVDMKDKIETKEGLEFKKISLDFEKTLAAAFVNRPEMKINSLMVSYYDYGKSVAKAKGWPKIDIMGNWGLAKEEYASPDLGNDADQKLEQQWYAGIKGSIPLWGSTAEYSWTKEQWVPMVSAFQGTEATTSTYKFNFLDKLNYYSDKQAAIIDFDRARQELIKTKQDVTLEVREGYFNYEKALIQLDTASSKVKYQEGDLELVKLKRGMDEAQDSNVIESMIKLAQEKFGYVQALSDCHIAVASINKAVGSENHIKDEEAVEPNNQ